MGKAEERLNQALNLHLSNIHETFQELDQTPVSSLDKVSWDEVIKMGEQLSKQATMGESPEVEVLEENMQAYFNILQGVLLLAYGSTVGAGPTLSSNIHASIKQVIDCSFMLWRESVSSYGSHNKERKLTISQLVGTVWDACSALKKTPATNITAIGRAMTQVAVSVKDVLREMKELRPCSSDSAEAPPNDSSNKGESQLENDDDSGDDDLGKDLSAEEMKIAQLASGAVSELLNVIKELIRSITSLLKKENLVDNGDLVQSLEKLLKLCQSAGIEVDELGASLYPPQELSAITARSKKISSIIDEMQQELETINGSTTAFSQAGSGLKRALDMLDSHILATPDAASENPSAVNLVPQMQDLLLQN
ncbi:hypothetical protein Ancab_021115 [Ancistrocladus abbreviatus]